ncbi:MAG TPA: chemotaxis protein CheB, partial [Stenomitos sp.]
MTSSQIRVFLVEDSPVALHILERLLSTSSEVTVVGTARNGLDALEAIPKIQPDVICTDLAMGKMDGLELIQRLMKVFPRPILAISQSVQPTDTEMIFRLLEAGAVDVFAKPRSGLQEDYERSSHDLIFKIKVLAGVKVFTKRRYPCIADRISQESPPPAATVPPRENGEHLIVAIGASTGGPQTIHRILSPLKADFPCPIICVQHISPGFLEGLVGWLNAACRLEVTIARAGDRPSPGFVYFAPEGHHLILDECKRFVYSDAPPIDNHRPSVTATFRSVAEIYGAESIGVLLTGMGRDGAAGLLAIARAGGRTIA